MALDNFFDLFLGHCSDKLIRYLPTLKYQEGRDAANIEFPGSVDILIDVQLHYLQLAQVVLRNFFHGGSKHVAWAAPIGPEIHEHGLRLARFNHIFVKACITHRLNIF